MNVIMLPFPRGTLYLVWYIRSARMFANEDWKAQNKKVNCEQVSSTLLVFSSFLLFIWRN